MKESFCALARAAAAWVGSVDRYLPRIVWLKVSTPCMVAGSLAWHYVATAWIYAHGYGLIAWDRLKRKIRLR